MIYSYLVKIKYIFYLILFFSFLIFFSISNSNADVKEIDWDDLIPWTAVFTPSEVKFNEKLENKEVKLPGYVIPLDYYGREINTFLLVPYVGACIHVPPPPPNQIVYVDSEKSWDAMEWWEPVFVTGTLKIEIQDFDELAVVGYALYANDIEFYRGETGTHGFFDW